MFTIEWLSSGIETNPGPIDIAMITLNCRGLKKEHKFKQLLSRINSENHTSLIAAFQETHIERNNLKYIWGGKHIFTESDGSKGGIITLLSDNVIIREQIDIGHEAHIALVEILDHKEKLELILVNLHSPCSHNKEKIDFFMMISLKL